MAGMKIATAGKMRLSAGTKIQTLY